MASAGSLVRDLTEKLRLDVFPCACARPSRLMPRSITGEALPVGGGYDGGGGGAHARARARVRETTHRISVTVQQQPDDHSLGRGRVISMVTSDGGAPSPATPYRATTAAVAAAGTARPRTVSVEMRKYPDDRRESVASVSFSDTAQRGLKSVSFMAGTNFVSAAQRGALQRCVSCVAVLLPCCADTGVWGQPPERYSRRRRSI